MKNTLFALVVMPALSFSQSLHLGTWTYKQAESGLFNQQYTITVTYSQPNEASFTYVISEYKKSGEKREECNIRYKGVWKATVLDDGVRRSILKQVQEDYPEYLSYFDRGKYNQTYYVDEQGTSIELCECVNTQTGARNTDMEDFFRRIFLHTSFRLIIPEQGTNKTLYVFVPGEKVSKINLRTMHKP
ncbi:hypothetical protein [Spirosoma sp.]|uniref:hypothetical protein n=1 Tax=Spirosoma sp. TaxID=1899569 RepID=UPI00261822CD|nr:hypothetical protein [Spirosoma sp.]MCX6212830.1 hypothetical protein [Spirosoma sp.]